MRQLSIQYADIFLSNWCILLCASFCCTCNHGNCHCMFLFLADIYIYICVGMFSESCVVQGAFDVRVANDDFVCCYFDLNINFVLCLQLVDTCSHWLSMF